MQRLDELGKKLEQSGKAGELRALAETPEGKKLGAMLDQGKVESAVKSGDTAALQSILRQVLSTNEGKALAKRLSETMK